MTKLGKITTFGIIAIIAVAVVVVFAIDWKDTEVEKTPQPLFDGTDVQGLGQFHDSPVENGVKTHSSDKFGISFDYPSDYLLFENKGGVVGIENYTLMIAPEIYIREAIAHITASQWPPSMYLFFYREPNFSISLEQWIRTKPQSNFSHSDQAQQDTLTPTTVAGMPAFKYHASGLYEIDYIAFTYGEWVVLIAVEDMMENTAPDLQIILSSIQLK